jgi:hypothetical protein
MADDVRVYVVEFADGCRAIARARSETEALRSVIQCGPGCGRAMRIKSRPILVEEEGRGARTGPGASRTG